MSELSDIFTDIASEQSTSESPRDQLKTVSVRLSPFVVSNIDALCAASGMKRQAVLKLIIENGIEDAVSGFLSGADEELACIYFRHFEELTSEFEEVTL